MRKVLAIAVPVIVLLGVIGMMVVASQGVSMPVVDTKGMIANSMRDTLYLVVFIMLLVVVPVFYLTFFIAFKYRASNKKSRYQPEWASHKGLETIWWGVPILIVGVLSYIAWETTHRLDPYKPISNKQDALQIQVVALQWKWLFIYPNEQIATVRELAFPVDKPVEFTLTSDAPMNSFWIPQLGGQIYAMAGMSTKLHLSADEIGNYKGVSANLSGEGHSSMTFTAKALSDGEYKKWINDTKKSKTVLDDTLYKELRLPSLRGDVTYYGSVNSGLYDRVVERYSSSHMTTQKTESIQQVAR